MNRINLIGRLVRENELKYTKNGKAYLFNTIALDDGWGDNKKSYFFPFVAWDKQAEAVTNHTSKGSKIALSGKLTSRTYEKNGDTRTAIEIVADPYGGVEFLDSKNSSQGGAGKNFKSQNNPFGNDGTMSDVSDDTLPF